jgi:hypothetical protein
MKGLKSLHTIPLQEEDIYHLRTVINTRIRTYSILLLSCIAVSAYYFLNMFYSLHKDDKPQEQTLFLSDSISEEDKKIIEEFAARYESTNQPKYTLLGYNFNEWEELRFICLAIAVALFLIALYAFVKRINPYRKDIRCGVKEAVLFNVVDKSHFPITGEYYLKLHDPRYLHHKVDFETYCAAAIGDVLTLYRGVYSKHIFERDNKFIIF